MVRKIIKMLTGKEITIMEMKQLKYGEQTTKEDNIKENINFWKQLRFLNLAQSCGSAMVQMIDT